MKRRLFLQFTMLSIAAFTPILLYAHESEQDGSRKTEGKVRTYEQGNRIGIDIRPQVEKVYDLTAKECTYSIDPEVQVGSSVVMEEKKDIHGNKLVSIRIKR